MNEEEKEQTPPEETEETSDYTPCNFNEMKKLHDDTQKDWNERVQVFKDSLEGVNILIGQIKKEIHELNKKWDDKFEEQSKKLIEDYKRLKAQEELNRKLREELDLKDELDKVRDEKIEDVKKSLEVLSKEVHDEIKELRSEVAENRKERREDIEKLGKKIDKGFKTAKKERGEESKDIKNDARKTIGVALAIIVPIIVALLNFILNHQK